MKSITLTAIMILASTFGYAQKISEPEYIGQVAIVNADSTTTLLQKEAAEQKAKSSGLAYIPIAGAALLDKAKVYLAVKGASSPTKSSAKSLTLVIRAKDNNEEPKAAFGIFKFDAKKKERRYALASSALLSTKATTTFTTVPYKAKKYGTSSYWVVMENLEPGEYGVVTGDLGSIATFSVK